MKFRRWVFLFFMPFSLALADAFPSHEMTLTSQLQQTISEHNRIIASQKRFSKEVTPPDPNFFMWTDCLDWLKKPGEVASENDLDCIYYSIDSFKKKRISYNQFSNLISYQKIRDLTRKNFKLTWAITLAYWERGAKAVAHQYFSHSYVNADPNATQVSAALLAHHLIFNEPPYRWEGLSLDKFNQTFLKMGARSWVVPAQIQELARTLASKSKGSETDAEALGQTISTLKTQLHNQMESLDQLERKLGWIQSARYTLEEWTLIGPVEIIQELKLLLWHLAQWNSLEKKWEALPQSLQCKILPFDWEKSFSPYLIARNSLLKSLSKGTKLPKPSPTNEALISLWKEKTHHFTNLPLQLLIPSRSEVRTHAHTQTLAYADLPILEELYNITNDFRQMDPEIVTPATLNELEITRQTLKTFWNAKSAAETFATQCQDQTQAQKSVLDQKINHLISLLEEIRDIQSQRATYLIQALKNHHALKLKSLERMESSFSLVLKLQPIQIQESQIKNGILRNQKYESKK